MWGWGEEPIWPCEPSLLVGGRRRRSLPPRTRVHRRVPFVGDEMRAYLADRFAEGMTLQEIGTLMGVTRERIRQLQKRYGIERTVGRIVRGRQRRERRIWCGRLRLPPAVQKATADMNVIPRNKKMFDVGSDRFIIRRGRGGRPWKPPVNSADHPGYWHFMYRPVPADVDYVVFVTGDGHCYVVPRDNVPRSPNIPAGPVKNPCFRWQNPFQWGPYRDAWPWRQQKEETA